MDFFETRERYRRREMRSYVSILVRVAVVGSVLWLGWVWGHAETASLKAEAERALYENNQQISELSTEVQSLELKLAEAKAKNKVNDLVTDSDADLKALVTKKIARGVAPAQIMQAIQDLGAPKNCRELGIHQIAVATPVSPPSQAPTLASALCNKTTPEDLPVPFDSVPVGSVTSLFLISSGVAALLS